MTRFFISIFFFSIVACASNPILYNLDALINKNITSRYMPGAVLQVAHLTKGTIYQKAYGKLGVTSTKITTLDTIYDLASISKVVTAMAIMKLHDQGVLKVSDPLSKYFQEYSKDKKSLVTIEMVLRHRAGIAAVNYLADFVVTSEIWPKMKSLPLVRIPGESFIYSDVGFMLLGRLIHELTGSLDEYVKREIFQPLKMNATSYGPRLDPKNTAHTSTLELAGQVHDPRSGKLAGIAGHAGVFSSAADFSKLVVELGACSGRVLKRSTCELMSKSIAGTSRGLGVDIASAYSSSLRGDIFEEGQGFGHSGYTGTSFWMDKKSGIYIILLTNRVQSGDSRIYKKKIIELRRGIANLVGANF
jgi:CubicO group peptidase (beta-lactamase class C family)